MVFNAKDGFLEGIIRGCRGGLLSVQDYTNLTQCETLDDVKLHLVSRRKDAKPMLRLGGRLPDEFSFCQKSYHSFTLFHPHIHFQCSTDYVSTIQNEPSPLHPSTIVSRCTQKIVDDFNMVRCQVRRISFLGCLAPEERTAVVENSSQHGPAGTTVPQPCYSVTQSTFQNFDLQVRLPSPSQLSWIS